MSNNNNNSQSTWQIIIGIATIIGALAFLAKIFGKDENEENDSKAKRSRKTLYKEVKPSFADYRYSDWTKILITALMLESTEDEDAVYSVFSKVKNISDVEKIIEFFGTQRKMFTTQYVTLPEAISTYFNASEKRKLNAILAKKRIDYQFE